MIKRMIFLLCPFNFRSNKLMAMCWFLPVTHAAPNNETHMSRNPASSSVNLLGLANKYRLATCQTTSSTRMLSMTIRSTSSILSIIFLWFILFNSSNSVYQITQIFICFILFIQTLNFFHKRSFIGMVNFHTCILQNFKSLFF